MTSNLPGAAGYQMRSDVDEHLEGPLQASLLYSGPARDACLVVDACVHYILKAASPTLKCTVANGMESNCCSYQVEAEPTDLGTLIHMDAKLRVHTCLLHRRGQGLTTSRRYVQ